MRLLTFFCLFLTSAAAAQDVTYSDDATHACLQTDTPYRTCVGSSADRCMQDTPGGYSTYAMGGCLDRELAYWDRMLNKNYKLRMAEAKQNDTLNGENAPSQAAALKQMQRAWIPFRDEKCGFERSRWGGGTGGGPAMLSCLMYETAEQAIYLGTSWGG